MILLLDQLLVAADYVHMYIMPSESTYDSSVKGAIFNNFLGKEKYFWMVLLDQFQFLCRAAKLNRQVEVQWKDSYCCKF